MSRKSDIDWSVVDWKQRDISIARELGCSRERVRQVRKEKGEARSPLWHKRTGTSSEKILKLNTKGMLPKEVAKIVGCTAAYAVQILSNLKKDYIKPFDGRCKHKYAWSSVTKKEWLSMTDEAVAKKLGVHHPAIVTQWRNRHNIVKRNRELVCA